MEAKEISITICDDFSDMIYLKRLDNSKIIRRRECVYTTSTVVTVLFLIGMFYWTHIVLNELDETTNKTRITY